MISFKLFNEYMKELKEVLEESDELDSALKKFSKNFGGFNNEVAIDLIFSILRELTHDNSDIIGYFIYELNWGKEWHIGCITENDKDIPMGNIKDLYNYLKEQYEDYEN